MFAYEIGAEELLTMAPAGDLRLGLDEVHSTSNCDGSCQHSDREEDEAESEPDP